MQCFLGISNFLEDISSLSPSIVFLYFFALITEDGFLISPWYSLGLRIQMGLLLLFSFAFSLLFFSQLFVRPTQTVILLFFFISFGEHYRDKLLQVFLNKKSITKFGPFLLLIYPRDSFKNSNSFKVCLSLTLLENRKIFPQHFVLLKIAYHTDLPFPI